MIKIVNNLHFLTQFKNLKQINKEVVINKRNLFENFIFKLEFVLVFYNYNQHKHKKQNHYHYHHFLFVLNLVNNQHFKILSLYTLLYSLLYFKTK